METLGNHNGAILGLFELPKYYPVRIILWWVGFPALQRFFIPYPQRRRKRMAFLLFRSPSSSTYTRKGENIAKSVVMSLNMYIFFFSFSSIFLTNYFLLIFALLLSSCNTTLSSLLVSPTLLCFVETSNFKK